MAKRTKKQPYQTFVSTPVAFIGGALTFAIVASLAFISPLYSAASLIIFAFSSFLYYENSRRRFWEHSTEAELNALKNTQKRIDNDLTHQRFDIDDARNDIKKINQGLGKKQEQTLKKAANTDGGREIQKELRKTKMKPRDHTQPRKKILEKFLSYAPTYPQLKPRRGTPKMSADDEGSMPSSAANTDPNYAGLSDMVVQELVHSAIREKHVEIFYQPIMRLPQRLPQAYEAFARIRARAGVYLPAARYMKLANDDGVMNKIDHLLLMKCLKDIEDVAAKDTAENSKIATPFFINITGSTLSNKLFMSQLLGFVSHNRKLAARLIFEIRQGDLNGMSLPRLKVLRGLGQLGCAFSIDHIEDLDFDIRMLQSLKVRYVKIKAADLFRKTRSEQAFKHISRVKASLEDNDIGVIVERIENEHVLKELLDFDPHYGQGYLLGKPDRQSAFQSSKKRIRRSA